MASGETSTFRNLTIPPGEERTIDATGNFVAIIKSNHNELAIALGDEALQLVDAKSVIGLEQGERFVRIRVQNTDAVSNLVVTLRIGIGFIVLPSSRFEKGETVISPTQVTVAVAAAVLLSARDATRRVLIVENPIANAREVLIGDSTIDATKGIEVLPGERIELETSAEVYCWNPHTAAVGVRVIELKD